MTLSTLCCTEKAENLYLSRDVFGLGERGPNVGAVTRSVVARVLAYALRSGRLAADKNRMTLSSPVSKFTSLLVLPSYNKYNSYIHCLAFSSLVSSINLT